VLLPSLEERCGVFALLPGLEERRPVLSVEDSTRAAALAQHSKYLYKKSIIRVLAVTKAVIKVLKPLRKAAASGTKRHETKIQYLLNSITSIEDPDQLFSKHISISSAELLNRFSPFFRLR
jgi:hypothetical protein